MTETTKSKSLARLQALEAVATRVRIWCASRPELDGYGATLHDTQSLFNALAALDALPADPVPAGVVEVALFGTARGGRCLADPSSGFASGLLMDGWRRLGTVRLPLVKGDGA
jgi:hypothetical protein